MKNITLAITGASGVIYGIRILEQLLLAGKEVNLLVSKAGVLTIKHEMDLSLSRQNEKSKQILLDYLSLTKCDKQLNVFSLEDWFAPIASGSSVNDAMIICPCTMSTLAKVANGLADDLLTRCADVTIKENRKLVIVPRETPLSVIHLENMLKLAKIGVRIVPPVPAFYTMPKTVDDTINFVVMRVLDQIGLDSKLISRW